MTTHLYIMDSPKIKMVRLGISSNIDVREKHVRNHSPVRTRIAWTEQYPTQEEARAVEKISHKMLRLKFRHYGSWYECTVLEALTELSIDRKSLWPRGSKFRPPPSLSNDFPLPDSIVEEELRLFKAHVK